MNVTLSPALVKFIGDVENFVRKGGSWAILVNDLTRTFHISGSYGLNSVLTAIAGSLLVVDHIAKKKTASTPLS